MDIHLGEFILAWEIPEISALCFSHSPVKAAFKNRWNEQLPLM